MVPKERARPFQDETGVGRCMSPYGKFVLLYLHVNYCISFAMSLPIAPLGTTVWRPHKLYCTVSSSILRFVVTILPSLSFPVLRESKQLSKRRIIHWVIAAIINWASINPPLRSLPPLRRLMDSTPISESRIFLLLIRSTPKKVSQDFCQHQQSRSSTAFILLVVAGLWYGVRRKRNKLCQHT